MNQFGIEGEVSETVDNVSSWLAGFVTSNMVWRKPAEVAAGEKLLSNEILGSMEQFMACFREEEACRKALFYLRWPNGFLCPQCMGHHYYYIKNRKLYECTTCRNQTSVTAHTFLHGTKLPLAYWFFTIYWVAVDQRCTAYRLAAVLKLHRRTALRMLHVIRAAMRVANGRHMLASVAQEEQMDQEQRDQESVNQGQEWVDQGQERIDGGNGPIEEKGTKYAHKHENKGCNENEGYTERATLLGRCRSMLLNKAKSYIRTAYRRVSDHHRQRYYDEFIYQWMQRHEKSPVLLSGSLLRACGTLVYREDIHLLIRPVFPSSQAWIRKNGVAHPGQIA